MIPELFYLQEFLVNQNNLLFYNPDSQEHKNDTITEEEIENVEIPKWSMKDPRFFTTFHRKMLEDPKVRRQLHKWLDLVFGSK